MKKISILFLLIFELATIAKSQEFYDVSKVQTIKLYIKQANWDLILDSLYTNNKDGRLIIDSVNINGVVFDSVGIKYKGNSSYKANNVKNPFSIKLNEVKPKQDYNGITLIKLSNGFKDPTLVREVMSYEFARNYMPAPRANYMNVYVNDKIHGLYTNVENPDDEFLFKYFYIKDNPLFKCDPTMNAVNPPGCPAGGGATFIYTNDDTLCYKKFYEIESGFGWEELVNAAKILNIMPDQAHTVFDIDRILWMLSFNNLLVNLDSYTGSGHNYYAYLDVNGRFNPILWDLNECFGVFGNAGMGNNLNLTQKQQMNPFINNASAMHPFISKLLSIPIYKKSYLAHYKTMLNEIIQSGEYYLRAGQLQTLIDQYVKDDPNKFYSYSNFLNNIQNSVSGAPGGSTPGIVELMEARKNFLQTQADFTKIAPDITKVMALTSNPTQGDVIRIAANFQNSVSQKLRYRFKSSDIFIETNMTDNGTNGDLMAGDGIYTGSIQTSSAGVIEYYLYAENADVSKFYPERAEFEFLKLQVKNPNSLPEGTLKINEILASNSTGVTDQNGQLEDWIEIKNNSEKTISLSGIFLSDNPDNEMKWAFPDTIIEPYGFLTIWADEDTDQTGLHANFKLSKQGENLSLTNLDKTVIDTFSYGEQNDDVSFGLCPNMAGEKGLMQPSFGFGNFLCLTDVEEVFNTTLKLFPVPTNELLNISLPKEFQNQIQYMEVKDLIGHSILLHINPFNSETTLNVSVLRQGFYILNIKILTGQILTGKFIKN